MHVYQIQTVQQLPLSMAEAWDFFSSPKNLRLITPPWLDFRLTNDVPDRMRSGTLITYTFRPVEGGVEMEDVVHYGLPFGVLGLAAHTLTVRRRVEEIFAYRREALEERFPQAHEGRLPSRLQSKRTNDDGS